MDSVQPTTLERFRAALAPGWARTVAARRCLAALLALVALGIAATGQPDGPQVSVLVAARELGPGVTLGSGDVQLRAFPAGLAPSDALVRADSAVGRSVTGPVAAGEVLTDRRVLTDRTAGQISPGARLVPVALQDSATMDLLRPGDVVDVVAQRKPRVAEQEDDGAPLVLARSATVAVAAAAAGAKQQSRTAMLAMSEGEAHAVAAAALSSPLSVVFR